MNEEPYKNCFFSRTSANFVKYPRSILNAVHLLWSLLALCFDRVWRFCVAAAIRDTSANSIQSPKLPRFCLWPFLSLEAFIAETAFDRIQIICVLFLMTP